ncbi:MAG: hypothetical protein Kow0092_11910 [Deferrisomatales bacterium]
MKKVRHSLRRRFLVSFAGLLAGFGVLSLAISLGSLTFYYRSTVEERTGEVSRRFEQALREAEEALLFRTRILADVARMESMGLDARLVREIQVYTLRWLKHDGLQVLGMGGAAYWRERALGFDALRRAFAGIPTVELHAGEAGPPMLLAATPREGPEGVAEVIVATLPLDEESLHRLGLRAGGELVLYGEKGRTLSSSFGRASVMSRRLIPTPQAGRRGTVTAEGRDFAYRLFPLRVGQRRYGTYAVLWPVGELRRVALRLALWQLAGLAAVLALFYALYRRIIGRTADDVEALTDWARAFHPDDPVPPPPIHRQDELAVLSEAFSSLAGDLKDALGEVQVKNRQLATVNLSLEEKVRAKTRELDEQRRLLDTVLSGMRQAVLLLDRDREVVYANPAARSIFGEVTGCSCESLWEGDGCPCRAEGGTVREMTKGEHTYLVTYTPLGGEGRSILVAQDITDRRALERRLQQAQKLESVGRLAAGVAHDFNNVLASIVPSVELLRRRVNDPKAVASLDTIEQAADRASAVVRQLLTFSRSGEFQPAPVDLNAAVEGALELLRPGLEAARIHWVPGAEVPAVSGDETQIQQMVLNLVLNAVDAMDGRGEVRVETAPARGGRAALLVVEDAGPGIPSHLAEKVFDPFFTTKEPGKGTGLGLSIVYGIVERHGGSVQLERSRRGGARFRVELPAASRGER